MLTKKQENVFKAIEKYINENGYSPTIRELCDLLKLKSTSTVQGYLERLETKGYIMRENGLCRTLRILKSI